MSGGQWRRVHLGIDAQTLEIRAIEITDNAIGDAPMLPELLGQIPADKPLHSVSTDGAYDTKACHRAIANRHAAAIIPRRDVVFQALRTAARKPAARTARL